MEELGIKQQNRDILRDTINQFTRILNRHKQSVHDGVKYPCDKCGFLATHKGYIKKHKESIHKAVRYSCGQCEYHATSQWHLEAHKQSIHINLLPTHTGELNIHVTSLSIRHQDRKILRDTNNPYTWY
jgi:ribosomal protein S27AE